MYSGARELPSPISLNTVGDLADERAALLFFVVLMVILARVPRAPGAYRRQRQGLKPNRRSTGGICRGTNRGAIQTRRDDAREAYRTTAWAENEETMERISRRFCYTLHCRLHTTKKK